MELKPYSEILEYESPAVGVLDRLRGVNGVDDGIQMIRKFHASCGLVTEVGELMLRHTSEGGLLGSDKARENLLEELGDLCWYHILLSVVLQRTLTTPESVMVYMPMMCTCTWLPEDMRDVHKKTTQGLLDSLVIHTSALMDYSKKEIFYGREYPTQGAYHRLDCCYMLISKLSEIGGTTIAMVRASNFAKLKKRYDKTFTEDAANHRDLEAEMIAHAEARQENLDEA